MIYKRGNQVEKEIQIAISNKYVEQKSNQISQPLKNVLTVDVSKDVSIRYITRCWQEYKLGLCFGCIFGHSNKNGKLTYSATISLVEMYHSDDFARVHKTIYVTNVIQSTLFNLHIAVVISKNILKINY